METFKKSQNIDCEADANCMNEDCQDVIVEKHNLHSEQNFIEMVERYHTPMYPGQPYRKSQIDDLLDGLDCTQGDYIKFNADDTGDNSDIVLSKFMHAIHGKYSVAFFKGLIRQFNPADDDLFLFFKAKDSSNNLTMAMKLNVSGTDVYFGDLVGLYP